MAEELTFFGRPLEPDNVPRWPVEFEGKTVVIQALELPEGVVPLPRYKLQYSIFEVRVAYYPAKDKDTPACWLAILGFPEHLWDVFCRATAPNAADALKALEAGSRGLLTALKDLLGEK